MERIKNAIERAKGTHAVETPLSSQQPFPAPAGDTSAVRSSGQKVTLNSDHLESERIIAHDIADPRSRFFDVLRTQVLQSMDPKALQFLGITSPTEGNGKTIVSINLALSIARLTERSVLLVDLDLQKPQVANSLGLTCDRGVLSVLAGQTKLSDCLIQAHIGKQKILVLPCEASTLDSSAWMASRSITALLQEIRQNFRAWTVILDLPPILMGDDVISILPQIDCSLLVTAAGKTTTSEVKEAIKHLESTAVVRVVINKVTDVSAAYYYSYHAKRAEKKNTGNSRSKPPAKSPLKRLTGLIDRIARFGQ